MSPFIKVTLLTVLMASLAVMSSADALPNLRAAEKVPTSITCDVSPWEVHLGLDVTVSGGITPYIEVPVTLTFIRPDGTSLQRSTWTDVGAWGSHYSYTFTPDMEGVWRVYASWPGNDEYYGATSEAVNFTVLPPITRTRIYISLPRGEVTVGDSLEVSGKLVSVINGSEVPIEGVSVIVSFNPPSHVWGQPITKSASTGDDGTFSLTFKPNAVGNWSVSASWEGNKTFTYCSASKQFTVLEKKFPWVEVVGGVVAVVAVVLTVRFLRRRGGS